MATLYLSFTCKLSGQYHDLAENRQEGD